MRIGRAGVLTVLVTAFVIGSAAGALAGAVPSGARASAHPGASETITVSVGDGFTYSLSSNQVTPGDTVTITLVDLGSVAHTFTLSPIAGFLFNSSDSTSHLTSFFVAHPPLVNLEVNGTPGQKFSQTFVAPPFGEYQYICNQSGHFSAGMYGTLGSGEPGSGASIATGPAWPVFAIGGGIAALIVATIVLAFVIGERPGRKHEMAPERLGYPETPETGPMPPKP